MKRAAVIVALVVMLAPQFWHAQQGKLDRVVAAYCGNPQCGICHADRTSSKVAYFRETARSAKAAVDAGLGEQALKLAQCHDDVSQ